MRLTHAALGPMLAPRERPDHQRRLRRRLHPALDVRRVQGLADQLQPMGERALRAARRHRHGRVPGIHPHELPRAHGSRAGPGGRPELDVARCARGRRRVAARRRTGQGRLGAVAALSAARRTDAVRARASARGAGRRDAGALSVGHAATRAGRGIPIAWSMTHSGNPFGQVLVALVTPLTADGEVDWPGVEKHIDDVHHRGRRRHRRHRHHRRDQHPHRPGEAPARRGRQGRRGRPREDHHRAAARTRPPTRSSSTRQARRPAPTAS